MLTEKGTTATESRSEFWQWKKGSYGIVDVGRNEVLEIGQRDCQAAAVAYQYTPLLLLYLDVASHLCLHSFADKIPMLNRMAVAHRRLSRFSLFEKNIRFRSHLSTSLSIRWRLVVNC